MSHTYNELETKINRTCKSWITIHHPEQQPEDLHVNMKKGVMSRSQMSRRTESLQVLKNLKHLNQTFGTRNVVVVDIDRGEVPQPIGCSAGSCCSPTLIGTRVTFSVTVNDLSK